MTAPRPISQVRRDTRMPAVAPELATPSSRDRVFSPNSTLATMRAQDLPALFISAIHAHSPTLIAWKATDPTTKRVSMLWTWAGVTFGLALYRLVRILARILPTVARPTIRLSALTTAPAYISRTAITTEAGGPGFTGSGVCPADETGWYMAAPRGQFQERAARAGRG